MSTELDRIVSKMWWGVAALVLIAVASTFTRANADDKKWELEITIVHPSLGEILGRDVHEWGPRAYDSAERCLARKEVAEKNTDGMVIRYGGKMVDHYWTCREQGTTSDVEKN